MRVFMQFDILLYGRANDKAEDKSDVGYLHTTYEVDPEAYFISRNTRTPLVLLAGLEMSNEANYRVASPTVFFGN